MEAIQEWLREHLAPALEISPQEFNLDETFLSYGLDSVIAVEMTIELEEWLGREIDTSVFYDYPTARKLAAHLSQAQD